MRTALFALLLAGCGDSFEEPASVDLSKNPYDFGIPTDGSGRDQSMPDFGGDDLAGLDFASPLDFTQAGDHDLSQVD
jgi:hypothetical protein